MLDAVELDGKFFFFPPLHVTCMYCKVNFCASRIVVHQDYLCFCKAVIKQILFYCSTLVQ